MEHQQSVRGRRRALRRLLVRALAVSALLHVALFLLWRVEPAPSPGGTRASAGATPSPAPPPEDALQAVEVARPAAEAREETDRPVVEARLPEAEDPPVREAVPSVADRMALERVPGEYGDPRLALAGGGEEGVTASEQGSGRAGEPGRISPPVPRSLLPHWDPPGEVRGTRVTVHVEVGRDGRPTGEVRLDPPTESQEFNLRLRETLTSLRYRPGRRAGEPVVAWAEITFVF